MRISVSTHSCHRSSFCYLQMPVHYPGYNLSFRPRRQGILFRTYQQALGHRQIVIDCNNKFISKYRIRDNEWIMGNPNIRETTAPSLQDPLWPTGIESIGLKAASTLPRNFSHLETIWSSLDIRILVNILGFQLTRQVRGGSSAEDTQHHVSPRALFPGNAGIQVLTQGLFSYLTSFLHSFGSAEVKGYMLFNLCSPLPNYLYRVLVLKEPRALQLPFYCCNTISSKSVNTRTKPIIGFVQTSQPLLRPLIHFTVG